MRFVFSRTRLAALSLLAAALIALCGCDILRTGEELYCLPELSEEDADLHGVLDQVLESGAQSVSPRSGGLRQSAQAADLDGDGETEIIAFFREEDGVTLRVCIFDRVGEHYSTAAVIEGTGTAIEKADCVRLRGEADSELLILWNIGDSALRYLGVYSLTDWSCEELLAAGCSGCLVTRAGDEQALLMIKYDTELQVGTAQLYTFSTGMGEKCCEITLPAGLGEDPILSETILADGSGAILLENRAGQSCILKYEDSSFTITESTEGEDPPGGSNEKGTDT